MHRGVFCFNRFVSLRPTLLHKYSLYRLENIRTYVKEDPTIIYDLHAAFSKNPKNVKIEDAYDDYTKIQQAAIRAGKRPPRKKKHKIDAVGNIIGSRYTSPDIPLRIRDRLITQGMSMKPNFFIGNCPQLHQTCTVCGVGRYGLNQVVVSRIRGAFRFYEVIRLEVGSPWTDNTDKFAERLEYRTGGIVLDYAGGRFLLYRGFTHADLARKGLLDPNCFTMPHGNEHHPGNNGLSSWRNAMRNRDAVDDLDVTSERPQSAQRRANDESYIDLDDGKEDTIVKEDKNAEQEEKIKRVMERVRYREQRLRGVKAKASPFELP